MNAEVEEFLAEIRPPVKDLVMGFRAFILAALPEVEERVDFGNRLLVYQLAGDDTSHPVYELRPCRTYLELRLWQGDRLEDPQCLLGGMGSGLRHLRVETDAQASATAVQDLINQAAELARALLPGPSVTSPGSLGSFGEGRGVGWH